MPLRGILYSNDAGVYSRTKASVSRDLEQFSVGILSKLIMFLKPFENLKTQSPPHNHPEVYQAVPLSERFFTLPPEVKNHHVMR